MKILFLGDVVGPPGREAIRKNLQKQIKINEIDFVIVNGENAADEGVGITEKISNEFFDCGVDVITTGNHVWDQRETADYINKEKRKQQESLCLLDIKPVEDPERYGVAFYRSPTDRRFTCYDTLRGCPRFLYFSVKSRRMFCRKSSKSRRGNPLSEPAQTGIYSRKIRQTTIEPQ